MLHCSTYSRASVTRGLSCQVMYSTLFNIFPRFGYKGSEPPGTVCYTVQHIPALRLQGVRATRYCMLHCSTYSRASVTRGPSRQVMYSTLFNIFPRFGYKGSDPRGTICYTVQHIPALWLQGVRAAR